MCLKISFLEISVEDVGLSVCCTFIGPGGAETELSLWTGTEGFGQIKRRIFFVDSKHCVDFLKITEFLSWVKFEAFRVIFWRFLPQLATQT